MRAPTFSVIVLLAGILISRESRRPGPIGGIDRAFFDWLCANAHPKAAAAGAGVTLIEIDDAVIDAGRWPFAPLDYALFLQAVQKYDAAVIAIEPVLDWSRAQPGNEEILLNQALTAPKLLLGATLGSAQGIPDAASVRALENVTGNVVALPQFPEVVSAPNARIFPLATCGVINLPPPGQPVREVPLLFARRGEVLPSFTLAALALWFQLAPGEVSAIAGSSINLGEAKRLAVDREGKALLDASVFAAINRVSYDDMLYAADDPSTRGGSAFAQLKGGLVVLGRTDHAARIYPRPAADAISPAELFAWAAQSLRTRPALRRASHVWDAAIIAIAICFAPWLCRLSRFRAIGAAAVAFAVYGMAALLIFQTAGIWMPGALPFGLMICAAAGRFLFSESGAAAAQSKPTAT